MAWSNEDNSLHNKHKYFFSAKAVSPPNSTYSPKLFHSYHFMNSCLKQDPFLNFCKLREKKPYLFSFLFYSTSLEQKINIWLSFAFYPSDCVEHHLHKPWTMLYWVIKGSSRNGSSQQLSVTNKRNEMKSLQWLR